MPPTAATFSQVTTSNSIDEKLAWQGKESLMHLLAFSISSFSSVIPNTMDPLNRLIFAQYGEINCIPNPSGKGWIVKSTGSSRYLKIDNPPLLNT